MLDLFTFHFFLITILKIEVLSLNLKNKILPLRDFTMLKRLARSRCVLGYSGSVPFFHRRKLEGLLGKWQINGPGITCLSGFFHF